MAEGGLDIKDRKYSSKIYKNCFIGTEFVQWLIRNNHASGIEEAVSIGNKMLDKDFLFHVLRDHKFKNEALFYVFIEQDKERGHADPTISWKDVQTV